MESIALESVDDHGSLRGAFKVCKSEVNLRAVFGVSGNESELFESLKGSKDVGHFSIGSVFRETFNVNCASGIRWNLHQLLILILAS